jgi:pimeloyl-ACP methyl ester carboxylesterase
VQPLARGAVAVAAAGIASAVYQQVADAADRRHFPPPGQLADVGGGRLHILAEGAGSPAVVIVPALGSSVLEWIRVQRAAAGETAVCVVDRAGIGWSDPPRGPVTIDGMARDLHALLGAAGIAPPYVIAGQSMGGIVARRFQAAYPDEVAGMLLVDSSHEDQARRFGWRDGSWPNIKRAAARQARILGARRLAANLGRVDGLDAESLARETVPEYAGAARMISLSSRERNIVVREILLMARSQAQPQDLGTLPLTVITAASPERREWPSWRLWEQMQEEFAALSAGATHIFAINAGHHVHLDDPELVAQAIRDLVGRARKPHPAGRSGA